MPYAYIQEITGTSMAGKIRRFKHDYMSMWEKLHQPLPFEVLCGTDVLKVKRVSCGASVTIKNTNGEGEAMDFDKIIFFLVLLLSRMARYIDPLISLMGKAMW